MTNYHDDLEAASDKTGYGTTIPAGNASEDRGLLGTNDRVVDSSSSWRPIIASAFFVAVMFGLTARRYCYPGKDGFYVCDAW